MSQLSEKVRSHFIRNGVQRANRFQVTIPLPKKLNQILSGGDSDEDSSEDGILGKVKSFVNKNSKYINAAGIALGLNSNGERSIQFVCRATEVPGVQIKTESHEYNGHVFKMATGVDRDQVGFVFQLSEDMWEKSIMDKWRSLVVNETTRLAGYWDDYTVDIQIDVLDTNDEVVFSTWLVDAYPTTISSISMNKMATDMANTLDTSWAFVRVSPVAPKEDPKPGDYSSGIPGSIGGIVDGIANGDLESAAYSARQIITEIESGNFTGEAAAIMDKINGVVRDTTGVSVTEMEKVGKNLKKMVSSATSITSDVKDSLHGVVDKLLRF